MITENLSTLKIHKLTQEQYDRELAAGNIDETALYLTPDSGIHIASKTGESPVLNDSAAGGLKIDRICGVSKQETGIITDDKGNEIVIPNPEYPQPIVSAGQKLVDGVVTDVGISKKLTGKNLLKNTAKSQTINGVTFTVNNNKSITISGTNDNTNVSDLYIYGSANDNGNYLNIPKGSIVSFEGIQKSYVELICREKETVTYNLEQLTNLLAERDCQFYGIFLRVNDGASANATICPMIRYADIEDDTYEPYTEQTLTLNHVLRGIPLGTDIPEMFKSNALHMDGIYWNEKEQQYYIADTIDAERGVLVQRVEEIVSDGSDDEFWFKDESLGTTTFSRLLDEAVYFGDGTSTYTICDRFGVTARNYWEESLSDRCMIAAMGGELEFINVSMASTLDEWLIWLHENHITAHYTLATPIETPLTDEEIIALHQLKTYQGVTHIFGSNDPDATMIFKYSSSEIGGVTLENSNLHAVNEVLRRRMLTHSDVVDNLASTDADVPLSANQGRVLKDELDDLKDEIPDVLPINKGGTGATDADTALANLGGVKASETIKTAFYDDAAENIGQLLDAKCAHARELNAPAVCIYGGWQNIDFGVFYAQVVNNVVQGIYVKGDTAYIVRCDNGTDTATYSKVALQSDIDEDIPYKVVIDDTAGTINFIDR